MIPLYILRPEIEMLSIEDINIKIKVLEHGVLISSGPCSNRLKRIELLDSYLQIKNGINSIL
jgi:hypothetical protein